MRVLATGVSFYKHRLKYEERKKTNNGEPLLEFGDTGFHIHSSFPHKNAFYHRRVCAEHAYRANYHIETFCGRSICGFLKK